MPQLQLVVIRLISPKLHVHVIHETKLKLLRNGPVAILVFNYVFEALADLLLLLVIRASRLMHQRLLLRPLDDCLRRMIIRFYRNVLLARRLLRRRTCSGHALVQLII
jgi:hypothetical protein